MPFDMPRHNWTKDEIEALYTQPLDAVGFEAAACQDMAPKDKKTLIDAR